MSISNTACQWFCPFVHRSVCPSVRPFVRPSVRLSICLSVCLSLDRLSISTLNLAKPVCLNFQSAFHAVSIVWKIKRKKISCLHVRVACIAQVIKDKRFDFLPVWPSFYAMHERFTCYCNQTFIMYQTGTLIPSSM